MAVRNPEWRSQVLDCSIFIADIARIKTGARESPVIERIEKWITGQPGGGSYKKD